MKSILLNYSSNIIVAYVNCIRYSKKVLIKVNPQPMSYGIQVQRLDGCGHF